MENDLAKVNPRDITIADASQVNELNNDVTEMIRETDKTIAELDCLDTNLSKLITKVGVYKGKASSCRKKMEDLSTEL